VGATVNEIVNIATYTVVQALRVDAPPPSTYPAAIRPMTSER
jgi:hypothetical protein